MTNEYVLSRILHKLLSTAEKKAITTCANLGLGNNRDLTGIRGVASSVRADPQVVAAAFLFLPVLGNRDEYIDVLDIGPDAIDTAVLPDHKPTIAAFALGRLALGPANLCPMTSDRHPQ